MKAIRLKQMNSEPQIALADLPEPRLRSPQEAVVRVLCIGLDGTDREILTEHYGQPPEGENELTNGHESLGVVVEAGPQSAVSAGDLVTALVRRPCLEPGCVNCRNGRADYCESGKYTERGIKGEHGYLAEYYVEEDRYLVKVPVESLSYGVLAEPQSIVEKVWEQVQHVQQRLIWEPKTAVILGAGPLGLLAAATCRCLGLEVHVWSKGGSDSQPAERIREIGGVYRSADAPPGEAEPRLTDYVRSLRRPPDLLFECTGFSPLAFEAMDVLGPNGVLALLGVTPGKRTAEIPSDALNRQIVMQNKCVLGSVNASRKNFETGLYRLRQMEEKFPGWLGKLMTDRIRIEQVPQLDFSQIGIKAVVDVVPRDQWKALLHPAAEAEYSFSV
jgi:threonine dehydrogenase-like Zn-dependent dehydrogenase